MPESEDVGDRRVGSKDGEIFRLPTAAEGKVLKRGAEKWEAGDAAAKLSEFEIDALSAIAASLNTKTDDEVVRFCNAFGAVLVSAVLNEPSLSSSKVATILSNISDDYPHRVAELIGDLSFTASKLAEIFNSQNLSVSKIAEALNYTKEHGYWNYDWDWVVAVNYVSIPKMGLIFNDDNLSPARAGAIIDILTTDMSVSIYNSSNFSIQRGSDIISAMTLSTAINIFDDYNFQLEKGASILDITAIQRAIDIITDLTSNKGAKYLDHDNLSVSKGAEIIDGLLLAKAVDVLDSTYMSKAKGSAILNSLTLQKAIDIITDLTSDKGAEYLDHDNLSISKGVDIINGLILAKAVGVLDSTNMSSFKGASIFDLFTTQRAYDIFSDINYSVREATKKIFVDTLEHQDWYREKINGGFEDGLSGWEIESPPSFWTTIDYDFKEGSHTAHCGLPQGAVGKNMYQYVGIPPIKNSGNKIYIHVWVKHWHPTGGFTCASLSITFIGNIPYCEEIWHEFDVDISGYAASIQNFVIDPANTGGSQENYIRIDDIYIYEAP